MGIFDFARYLWPDAQEGRQPQVNTRLNAYWLARGLAFVHNPAVGNFNLVNNQAPRNTTGAFPLDLGPSGLRINAAGSSYAEFSDNGLAASGNSLTLISIWRAKSTQYASADATRILLSPRTAGNTGWGWGRTSAIGGGTNGNLTAQTFVLNGIAQYIETNSTIESLVDTVVAFRAKGTVASWFRNGVRSSPDTTIGTASTGGPLVFGAGGPFAGPNSQWNDRAYLTVGFTQPLSDVEIKWLSDNLHQIIDTPLDGIYLIVSSGSSLSASATGSDTAVGSASLAAQVALAGIGVSTASGATGASVAVPLSAAGISVAGGNANGTATVTLSAAGLAQAAGTAGLSTTVLRSASGAALASGNATLAAQLNALANGAAQASGTANLTGGAPGALSANGGDVASGSAVLSVTVQLAASGADQASGSATGTAGAPGAISASGQAHAGGSATWSSLVTLTAAGFVQAMGAGFMAITVPLSAIGQAVTTGHATGSLLGLVKNYRLTSTIERLTPLSAKVARCTQLSTALARLTTLHHEVSHGA